ncbi:cyclic nucleotide-binding protein [Nitzschia inconspicua]|uniref:Cyclic nucleotide-binding protein n=1 Tax=Nitzschia inconspicua TaxID=303405 RepID=A0A9K3KU62_9STRA|nr:cyclic nucleotide-binding protein [Nitzschia inconspicua]
MNSLLNVTEAYQQRRTVSKLKQQQQPFFASFTTTTSTTTRLYDTIDDYQYQYHYNPTSQEDVNAAWRFASLHGSSIGQHSTLALHNEPYNHPHPHPIVQSTNEYLASLSTTTTTTTIHTSNNHLLPQQEQQQQDYFHMNSDVLWNEPQSQQQEHPSSSSSSSLQQHNQHDKLQVQQSMPKLHQGIYQLTSEEEYRSFIHAHPDKLVVVKFYAAYCKACRSLAPKFLEVKDDPQLQNLPVVWAEFQTTKNSKELFRRLGVLTLPTVHFYDGGLLDVHDDGSGTYFTPGTVSPEMTNGQNDDDDATAALTSNLIENFPCPPAKIKLLKKKLARFMNSRVDPTTLQLKPLAGLSSPRQQQYHHDDEYSEDAANNMASHIDHINTSVAVLASNSQATGPFPPDIVDQPRKKRAIVIDNELIREEHLTYLRSGMLFFEDLSDDEFDTMIQQAKLLTFDAGDIICKQGMPGTTFYVIKRGVVEMSIKSRFEDPIRTPPNYLGFLAKKLRKFDYFGERALSTGQPLAASFRALEKSRIFAFHVDIIPESSILSKNRKATQEMIDQLDQRYLLPKDYVPPTNAYSSTEVDSRILDLLVRFKQIRQAARCFSYIMQTEPRWNDPSEIARRAMLVSKLSESQRIEFEGVFEMVDVKKCGIVSLLEMRQFMNTARERKTDAELMTMIYRANPAYSQTKPEFSNTATISRTEFLGVMAEAEFYNLFTETFQELDRDQTGYVRAGDLSEVLGGVQDLIADEKKINLIDVDDSDMLIDYEQFSKMLLGAAF